MALAKSLLLLLFQPIFPHHNSYNKCSEHLHSAYYVLSTILSTSPILAHLILTATLQCMHYYDCHVTNEKTEVQRG